MLHHVEASISAGGAVALPDEANLFSLHNATDMSTLYQDDAKTTPVTGTGQVVGAMADISGNGNDFLQATASYKPTYSTSGSFGDCLYCYSYNQRHGMYLVNVPAQPRTIYIMSHRTAIYANDYFAYFGPPASGNWNDHIKGQYDYSGYGYDRTYDVTRLGTTDIGVRRDANPRICGHVANAPNSKFFSHLVYDSNDYGFTGYTGTMYLAYHPAYTNPQQAQYIAAVAIYSAAHDETTANAVIAYLESITGYSF